MDNPHLLLKPLILTALQLLLLAGCGSSRPLPMTEPRGSLRFSGTPETASVEIDEHNLGPIHMFGKHGVLIKPGPHRVVLKADGYFSQYHIIEITPDRVHVLKVELRPIPE